MKFINQLFIIMILLSYSFITVGNILIYPFTDPVKEQRFNQMIKELRCPKCQNNNLADSNAGLAVDLKNIVYDKIKAGETDEQILFYLKERYGDFISYRPPLKPSTWIIWFGPFVILLLGGLFIFRFVAKNNTKSNQVIDKTSSDLSTSNSSSKESDLIKQWAAETKLEQDELK